MKTHTSKVLLSLICAVCLSSVGVSASTDGDLGQAGFFGEVSVAADGFETDTPSTARSRFFKPNLELLGDGVRTPIAEVLTLNLFEDEVLKAFLDRVERNASGSLTWIGHLDGMIYGTAVLVVKDGVVAGTISTLDAIYQIRHVGGSIHAIDQMDSRFFPAEVPPIEIQAPESVLDEAPTAPTADDGSRIDVLVVYTEAARAAAGGTTAIENQIDLAVTETNQSYENSNIVQRLNLVHTAEVVYDEAGLDWISTIYRLRDTSDGFMDNVHPLRDSVCADEVVLIVANNAYCGLAFLQEPISAGFAGSAFAMVSRQCATGYYSFAHEMGHNMGARHDWFVDDTSSVYTYNHGYVNSIDRWRTIMAYNAECSNQGFNCTRVQYWSNPGVLLGGDPLGVPVGTSTTCTEGVLNPVCDADNHLILDRSALTVANFRDSSSCQGEIFSDGFESGGTDVWSSTLP